MTHEPHINRRKMQIPRSGARTWCETCDAARIGEWEKCPVCGNRNGLPRLKKQPPIVAEWEIEGITV